MIEVEERVGRLERVLEEYIRHTNESHARTERELVQWRAQSERELAQWRAQSERELAQWGTQTQRELAQRGTQMQRELAQWGAQMERGLAETRRQLGELSNRLGTIVEDLVAPNIPRLAREHFGCDPIERFLVRARVRHPQDRGREREFDVVCAGERVVVWNETKASIRPEYLENFVAALPEFFAYFPEYRGRQLVPIFSSFQVPEDAVRFLTRHRVYAMAMGPDTMVLLNADALQSGAPTD